MNTKSTRKKSLRLGLGSEGSAKKKLNKNVTKNKPIENDENMFDIDEFNNQSTTTTPTTTIGMGKKNIVEIVAPQPALPPAITTTTTTITTTTTTTTTTSTTSECTTPKSQYNRFNHYENSPFDDYDDSDSSSVSPQFFTLTQRLGNEVTWRSPTKQSTKKNNDKEIEGTPKYIPRIRTQLIRQKIRKLKNQFDKIGGGTTGTNDTANEDNKQQPEEITGIYKFEEERKKLALIFKNTNTNKSSINANDHNNDDYQITRPFQRQKKPQSPLAAAVVASPSHIDLRRQSSGNYQMLFDDNDSFIADCSKKLENILQNQNYDEKPIEKTTIPKSIPIIKTQKITTDFKEFNKTIQKGDGNAKMPVTPAIKLDPFTNDFSLNDDCCLDNSNILKLLDDNDSLIIQCSQQFDEIFPVIEQQNLNKVNDCHDQSLQPQQPEPPLEQKSSSKSSLSFNNRKSSTPLKKSFSFKMKRETIYQKNSDINNKSLNEFDNDDLLLGSIEIDQFLINDDEPNRSKMKRYNSMPSPSSNSLLNNNNKFCEKIETKIESKNYHSSLAKIKNIQILSSSSENSSESGSSRCTIEEINEKRRIAINRLKNRTKQFSCNKGKS